MASGQKFLIAPNAFKGTINADRAADLIGNSILEKIPGAITEKLAIADGGDGTCFLLGKALKLQQVDCVALDALGRPISGYYFLDPKNQTAYLDVSTVSGIKHLKPQERHPKVASTFGTGELIGDAIANRARHIVLGLGGSASVDLGMGILRALGYLFLDEKGREITMFSDSFFSKIRHIQAPIHKYPISFTCLCDVRNTFFGPLGAVPVFGPQKGISPADIPAFEAELSEVLEILSGKSRKEIVDQAGFGAAGGIAFGLSFFFPVEIQMGARWFFEKTHLAQKLAEVDWIITGEGRYDGQSEGGKGCYELLQIAKKYKKKIALITSGKEIPDSGFDKWIQLPDLEMGADDLHQMAEISLRGVLDETEDWSL
jgi:glycerate kinase